MQFNGDIAEIVVYNHALSASDLTALTNALMAKYALDTPPTVSITAPTNNASYTAPASITITASATANTGTISKVEFYDGNTLHRHGDRFALHHHLEQRRKRRRQLPVSPPRRTTVPALPPSPRPSPSR